MMKIAKKNKKHITMDWSSAWYVYSFFGNTGLEIGLNEDGITNYCTWNKKDADVNGVDVAEAMLNIARHPGFTTRKDENFLTGVENGSTQSLAADMADISNRMDMNQEIVEELQKQTKIFANL